MSDQALTPPEAASLLGLSTSRVRGLAQEGKIRVCGHTHNGKHNLYSRDSVIEYIKNCSATSIARGRRVQHEVNFMLWYDVNIRRWRIYDIKECLMSVTSYRRLQAESVLKMVRDPLTSYEIEWIGIGGQTP